MPDADISPPLTQPERGYPSLDPPPRGIKVIFLGISRVRTRRAGILLQPCGGSVALLPLDLARQPELPIEIRNDLVRKAHVRGSSVKGLIQFYYGVEACA